MKLQLNSFVYYTLKKKKDYKQEFKNKDPRTKDYQNNRQINLSKD